MPPRLTPHPRRPCPLRPSAGVPPPAVPIATHQTPCPHRGEAAEAIEDWRRARRGGGGGRCGGSEAASLVMNSEWWPRGRRRAGTWLTVSSIPGDTETTPQTAWRGPLARELYTTPCERSPGRTMAKSRSSSRKDAIYTHATLRTTWRLPPMPKSLPVHVPVAGSQCVCVMETHLGA